MQLKRYGQKTNPETLHKIRAELKKIKTLFHLVAFYSDNFKAKHEYKPLKKIFKKAGQIRKMDVVTRLFQLCRISDNVKRDIIPEISKTRKFVLSFKNDINNFQDISKKFDRKMKKYFARISKTNFKKYLSAQKNEMQKKLSRNLRMRELHELRKSIKEVICIFSINKGSSKDIKYYHSLQNIIGNWHDKEALLQLLSKKKNRLHLAIIKKLKSESAKDIQKIKLLISKNKK